MKIKKGDNIKMLAGKDRGKTGKVLQVLASENKVSIEGLNLLIKHLRPQRQGDKGQRIEFPRFVAMSSVALVCPGCGKPVRVGYQISKKEDGKTFKVRVCKKCQTAIN